LPEDIAGKTDHDLFPTELAELDRADDLEVIKSDQPKSIEEPRNIGGRTVWSETYKSPVFLDGKIIGTVGFARDISERKAHQKQLEHIALYDILACREKACRQRIADLRINTART
jgi:PAS domain S-box-containing protein